MCHRRDTRWRFCHRWVRVINPGHSDEIQRGPMPSQGEGRREGAAAETNLQAASAGREQEGGCGLNPTRGRGRESTGCRESHVVRCALLRAVANADVQLQVRWLKFFIPELQFS